MRLVPAIIALLLIIASGVVHGLQSHRWGAPVERTAALSRLKQIPAALETWTSEDLEIPANQLLAAGAEGYVARRYLNRADGSTVNLMILAGGSGPISLHPPTVCFVGAGWQLTRAPERCRFERDASTKDAFWETTFRRDEAGTSIDLLTLWGWSSGGAWTASASPRFEFAGEPFLCKLYLTSAGTPDDPEAARRAINEFVKVFLPQIDAALAG